MFIGRQGYGKYIFQKAIKSFKIIIWRPKDPVLMNSSWSGLSLFLSSNQVSMKHRTLKKEPI